MEREGLIEIWDDNEITAGDKWREEIFSTNLPDSDLLLYLVSASSLDSEDCNRELGIALEENISPILVILENCDWKNYKVSNVQAVSAGGFSLNEWESQKLSDIQVLPAEGKPLNEWNPRSKGWQSVVDGLRKAIRKMQSQAELALQQGNFLMVLRQINGAIERYSHTIELNPNNAAAYNNRGTAYVKKGEFDRAIADHDKAIEFNPNYAEAYFNRGGAYKSKGDACQDKDDYDRAIADFTKAIDRNSNFAGAYNHRGVVYLDRGHYGCAIADFNKAIKLNPKNAEVYYNRGLAHFKKGDYAPAIEDFTSAIDRKPHFVREVYYNRGRAWLHQEKWQKAKADLKIAKEKGMDIITAFLNNYGSVPDFERITGIQLPTDIAAMLTPE